MMHVLLVYDPAMCCSTGVCGPSVDPKLAILASDLAWLKSHGVQVNRFSLSQYPDAFATSALVISEMGDEGENLPLFVVENVVKSKAAYPNRHELASWFGLEALATPEKHRKELKLIQS